MINHLKDFAVAKLTSKPNTADTTVTLDTGEEDWMPSILPAKMYMWDYGGYPDSVLARKSSKLEIVTVTDVTGSTVTITRSSSPVDFSSGVEIYLGQALTADDLKRRDSFIKHEANYTAKRGDRINGNTSGGSWTLKLPDSDDCQDDDVVMVTDRDLTWETNALTVECDGASDTVADDTDFLCDVAGRTITFSLDKSNQNWNYIIT